MAERNLFAGWTLTEQQADIPLRNKSINTPHRLLDRGDIIRTENFRGITERKGGKNNAAICIRSFLQLLYHCEGYSY